METRASLQLRLEQIQGALASAVADCLTSEARIERLEEAIKNILKAAKLQYAADFTIELRTALSIAEAALAEG